MNQACGPIWVETRIALSACISKALLDSVALLPEDSRITLVFSDDLGHYLRHLVSREEAELYDRVLWSSGESCEGEKLADGIIAELNRAGFQISGQFLRISCQELNT